MQDCKRFMNNLALKCHAAIDKDDLFSVCIKMIEAKVNAPINKNIFVFFLMQLEGSHLIL